MAPLGLVPCLLLEATGPLSCLFAPPSLGCRREQKEYYSSTAAWTDVHPSQLLGPPTAFKCYDLLTVSLEELKAPLKVGGVDQGGLEHVR